MVCAAKGLSWAIAGPFVRAAYVLRVERQIRHLRQPAPLVSELVCGWVGTVAAQSVATGAYRSCSA